MSFRGIGLNQLGTRARGYAPRPTTMCHSRAQPCRAGMPVLREQQTLVEIRAPR